MDGDGQLTVGQAARALGISRRAVQWRLATGRLRGENHYGRLWTIPRAELERAKAEPLRRGRPRKSAAT